MKYHILSFCFIFITLEYSAQENSKKILTVAHRGAASYAPENTIASTKKAIELNIDVIEMDVRETKDGYLVIMHDRRINRTTNGKGKVENLTLEELKKFDAGSWYGDGYKGEEIPTLVEMLRALKGHALPDIDFKRGDVAKLVKILEEEGFLDQQITFHTFKKKYAYQLSALTDKILLRPSIKFGMVKYSPTNKIPVNVVNLGWKHFSTKYIGHLQSSGKKVFVNVLGKKGTEANIRKAMDAGVEYIQADNLEILVKTVKGNNL
jgi:glycerophosphoryl diester phosphodiesterase